MDGQEELTLDDLANVKWFYQFKPVKEFKEKIGLSESSQDKVIYNQIRVSQLSSLKHHVFTLFLLSSFSCIY